MAALLAIVCGLLAFDRAVMASGNWGRWLWLALGLVSLLLLAEAVRRNRRPLRRWLLGLTRRQQGLVRTALISLGLLIGLMWATGFFLADLPERPHPWWARGSSLAIAAAMFIPAAWLWRAARLRVWHAARTCPACFSEGDLERKPAGSDERPGFAMLHCGHRLSDQSAEPCGYRFPEGLASHEKLLFTLLGVPRAGKSLWQATAMRELRYGHSPSNLLFEAVRNDWDDELWRNVDHYLQSVLNPLGNELLPRWQPMLWRFDDDDPWGRSSAILNVRNPCGDIFSPEIDHGIRDLARSNGFLWLFDLTQPTDPQLKAFDRFVLDLRAARQRRANEVLDVPLAVCLSKMDLLPVHFTHLMGGERLMSFFTQLAESFQDNKSSALESLIRRSELAESICDSVCPESKITMRLTRQFGRRWAMFPMAPLGLNLEREPDLRRRVISPVGVLDPLLWLLHANGFVIFPRRNHTG